MTNPKVRPKQISLSKLKLAPRVFNPGRRTTVASRQRRTVVMNESMHVVLKSDLARGRMSLQKNQVKVDALIKKMAKNHGVHIYKMATAYNHIHIHLRVTRRLRWKGFISGLTGGIARAVGFRRMTVGPSAKDMTVGRSRGFWQARPFSRLVSWGQDFHRVRDYVILNQLEASGEIPPRSQLRKGVSWRQVVQMYMNSREPARLERRARMSATRAIF